MTKKIIVVGRQFGSNGRVIGKALAQELGIGFYDRDIIDMAAQRSDIAKEHLAEVDEKPASKWLDAFSGEPNAITPINDILFRIESDIITDLAQKEDCIIVGRCADYVLRKTDTCRSIFIHAPFDVRKQTVMQRLGISEKEAAARIRKVDKERRYYYSYYTDRHWGEMNNYHLSLDSSVLGIDGTVNILKMMFESI